MKRVLLLGAGLVTRPLVQYLLGQKGYEVVVASRTVSKAEALIGKAKNGKAVAFTIDDLEALDKLVSECRLAISLLPAPNHPLVAEACLKHGKHLVTTSYVGPKMAAFDKGARAAGLLFLNEIGLDPGIDHMSAMKIIHEERKKGAKLLGFRSYCGGLPAPEANDNPWGYKFSWSPRGVVAAAKNSAKYLKGGKHVEIPNAKLFTDTESMEIEGVGTLETYPNRDSLSYIDSYGLKGIKTMFRGTFRYPGWCSLWTRIVNLGMLDEERVHSLPGMTYAGWMRGIVGCGPAESLRDALAKKLKLAPTAPEIQKLAWLGLLDEIPIPGVKACSLDILAGRLQEKLVYKPRERDMIVMRHIFDFTTRSGKTAYRITSTLVDFGEPDGDSSMSRTVGLPAAIATKLILSGKIKAKGVRIPVDKEIYVPVLKELEKMGVRFTETRE